MLCFYVTPIRIFCSFAAVACNASEAESLPSVTCTAASAASQLPSNFQAAAVHLEVCAGEDEAGEMDESQR
ncbi:hypothetical protein C8Q80DRAFT_1207237 [Daedaleopsis nitida]|nr:hypothetical protein C8Q80DRAFT_1207237 [Daedaleopsis nitida]